MTDPPAARAATANQITTALGAVLAPAAPANAASPVFARAPIATLVHPGAGRAHGLAARLAEADAVAALIVLGASSIIAGGMQTAAAVPALIALATFRRGTGAARSDGAPAAIDDVVVLDDPTAATGDRAILPAGALPGRPARVAERRLANALLALALAALRATGTGLSRWGATGSFDAAGGIEAFGPAVVVSAAGGAGGLTATMRRLPPIAHPRAAGFGVRADFAAAAAMTLGRAEPRASLAGTAPLAAIGPPIGVGAGLVEAGAVGVAAETTPGGTTAFAGAAGARIVLAIDATGDTPLPAGRDAGGASGVAR